MSGPLTEPRGSVDLYTPWREPIAALEARHVGRAEILDAMIEGGSGFAAGRRPLPMYLFGPRGIGKSHLLAVARGALARRKIRAVLVPEDIAAQREATRLVARIEAIAGDARPAVILFEGLDRQLRSLGLEERRALRRELDARADWWLVATGVTLPSELTGKDEAFYGAFDPWPIEPLDEGEAAALLDVVTGATGPRWPARRATLVTLAGGNPRALVALGLACREDPTRWASDQLHAVVHDFTAHYQLRFRDLAPQAQQIVEIMAEAPRELTPTELGEALASTSSQMSVQAGRLVDEGVLRQRAEGRQSFYRLAEPLFRYWLEYRTASWDQTRTGWLSRLIEALSSPTEIADAWWRHPDDEVRQAAVQCMHPGGAARSAAWQRVIAATRVGDLEGAVARAAELAPSPALRQLTARVIAAGQGALLERLAVDDLPDQRALLAFDAALRARAVPPKRAFTDLVEALAARPEALAAFDRELLIEGVVAALDQHRTGRPWRLDAGARARLAAVPGLRAYFAEHGRLRSHPPLLDPPDLLAALGEIVPDAARLIVVGAVRDAPTLVRRAAEGFRAEASFVFPPCPTPMRALDASAAAAVAEAAERAHAASRGVLRDLVARLAVSWAASFGAIDDARFEAITALVTEAVEPLDQEGDELPLAALALTSPARFERLARALGRRWQTTCDDARTLARELAQGDHGHLYPELSHLWAAAGRSPRPGPASRL